MTTASQAVSADRISEAIQDRDVQTIGVLAAGGTMGLFIAQEATNQILPMLGMSADPTSSSPPSELAAAAGVKLVGAVVFIALMRRVAGRRSGLLTGLTGAAAFGMLVSMGLELWDLLQGQGLKIPGNAPAGSGSTTTTTSQSQSTASPSISRSNGSAMASMGGSSYR